MSLLRSFLPAVAALSLLFAGRAAAEPSRPECIAPASPGGGFDLTCKLAQSGLVEAKALSRPMRVTYMPGGVGAVAYNTVVAQRPADGNVITAFSSGSLLNIAQGKFGRYDENAVRWLAAVGTSYGAIAVRSDSPYKTLGDLMAALKKEPGKVVIGSGGTVGSQDWMQTAMLAKAAGISPKQLRYVALEGGGEITTALLGGHIQVGSTDISDSMPQVKAGKMRILAVLSDKRLTRPGMASIPTAKEQGYDVVWQVARGFYVGPKVSDQEYAYWKAAFDKLLASKDFARLREQRELFPLALTGPQLDAYVKKEVARYRQLAHEFGLAKR
ncbi:Bug family tripartite tricarboxylate transporter substrate binding protein [Lysobacter sp. TAF61]|uniref:Bug family tripartite tricarboxylate transporter substrate binding protein n=1 Tax=Lysobacter sp. TAF61 TaxID=3233072 RepID=UPI003F9D8EAB